MGKNFDILYPNIMKIQIQDITIVMTANVPEEGKWFMNLIY